MIEEQTRRVHDRLKRTMDEIEKKHLRKMQGDMFRCAAECTEREGGSYVQINDCIQNCSTPFDKAQGYVTEELTRFQSRIQRCVLDCNDELKDKMGANLEKSASDKYRIGYEKCAVKCIDTFCDSLPALEKSVLDALSSGKYE